LQDESAAILAGKDLEHRAELAKLRMQVALYREALVEHGIEPPDRDGEELLQMWRDSAVVITTANAFVAKLSSAAELMSETWR